MGTVNDARLEKLSDDIAQHGLEACGVVVTDVMNAEQSRDWLRRFLAGEFDEQQAKVA